MKIGQISHVYPPHIGGIENYVYRLKQKLEISGDDVTVYTTDLGLAYVTNSDESINYCKTNISLCKNPFSYEFLRKIRNSNDEIYHLHGFEFFTSLFATKILKDKPKILTQHGTIDLKGDLISFVLNNPYRPLANYVLNNVDSIIVLGNYDKKFLINNYNINPYKINVIPNGLDLNRFVHSKLECDRFLSRYNLKEDSFKIISVGRLVKQKNVHRLIKAINILRLKFDIELIIIGDGDKNYVDYLNNIRSNCVHLVGKLPFGDELIAAYYVSDLFVLLSEHEGLPTTILEAMACGLPILTTPVGNIPDVVIENKNGFFIDDPTNKIALVRKIEYIINLDRNQICNENKNRVLQNFNWDTINVKIRNLYYDILQRRR